MTEPVSEISLDICLTRSGTVRVARISGRGRWTGVLWTLGCFWDDSAPVDLTEDCAPLFAAGAKPEEIEAVFAIDGRGVELGNFPFITEGWFRETIEPECLLVATSLSKSRGVANTEAGRGVFAVDSD
jgi:hypothetical protein